METLEIPLVEVDSLVKLRNKIPLPRQTVDCGGRQIVGRPPIDHSSPLEAAEFCSLDTPYSLAVMRNSFPFLNGQLVVDLGAGTTTSGYIIATRNGAIGYIGVERFNFRDLRQAFTEGFDPILFDFRGRLPGAALVKADMLEFLAALPNRSVSVLTCGIDRYILPTESYAEEVKAEIKRVLHTNGKHVSFHSEALK